MARQHDFRDTGASCDLHEFARRDLLDAYELTDRELAEMLEVWRWGVWQSHSQPTPTDHDILAATDDLRRQLAHQHNLDIEYNTLYLLRSEIEPTLHLRALEAGWAALVYFAHPSRWLSFARTLWRARRYRRTPPVPEEKSAALLYPRAPLSLTRLHAPDLLKRRYWHPIGWTPMEERKRTDQWH